MMPPTTTTEVISPDVVDNQLQQLQSGIDELEAPPPIQEPAEEGGIYLEDLSRAPTETSIAPNAARPLTPPINEIPPKKDSQFLLLAHTCYWLIFFSLLGTLSRLGLIALTTYPGSPLSGVIWANFAGCLIMGFLIEDLRLFTPKSPITTKKSQKSSDPQEVAEDSDREKQGPQTRSPTLNKSKVPLYLGLTTGFCGSVTSFSSYMLQSFLHLANDLPTYSRTNKGYSFLASFGYLIATLSLSLSGLQAGAQIAVFLQPILPTIPPRLIKYFDKSSIIWAIGLWVASIILSIYIKKWRGDILFACVFSPLGVLGRFWISKILNPRVKGFPFGTFTVNMVGTAILAGTVIAQQRQDWNPTGCQILRGIGDGFCGCLTTVSTWVVEVKGLRRMRMKSSDFSPR